MEEGEVTEVYIGVGVEVGLAPAGSSVDIGTREAILKEVEIIEINVAIAAVTAAGLLRYDPVPDVVPRIITRQAPGLPTPRDPGVVRGEQAFGNGLVRDPGIDVENVPSGVEFDAVRAGRPIRYRRHKSGNLSGPSGLRQ